MATSVPAAQVKKIVFACEAGMGSSLIGANQLKKKIKEANLAVTVIHCPVHQIPKDAQVVVSHAGLVKRARATAPWAVVIGFQSFVGNPVYDQLTKSLAAGQDIVEAG